MANKINWDFISELEGAAIKVGYVPDADSSQSGVTIGTGFDLGSKDEDFMTSIGVSSSITEKLKPFFKLKGVEAAKVANKLQLDDSEVKELDQASKNYYANKIIEKYEHDSGKSFDDLSSEQQTVITSVGFQYGSFDRTPAFWAAVTNGDWEGVEKELRNFGDNYSKRRIKEADLLGKKKVEALFVKDKTDKLPFQDIEGVKKVLEEVKEEPEKEEPFKYNPIKNLWNPVDQGGELYLDRVFHTYQNWTDKRESPSLGEGWSAAWRDNWIIPAVARMVTTPSFQPEDGWSIASDKEYVQEAWKDNNINPDFYNEFAGVVSRSHFDFTMQRVIKHQKNREILNRMGWTGTALEIGAFILDPVTWLGYGAAAKLVKPIQMATTLTRTQKFVRSGLIYGGTEATLISPVVADNPTYGTGHIIIALALGGTLGGGITALTSKNLNNIAKAEMILEAEEQGLKLTKKGEKVLDTKKIKKPFNNNDLNATQDIISDVGIIADIKLAFGRLRDLPFAFTMPWNRSGALGTSESELVRLFNFLGLEEPVLYTFKTGAKKGQVATQPASAELIRNQIIQGGHALIYGGENGVNEILKKWLMEQGHGAIGRLVGVAAMRQGKVFMTEVARVIRSGVPSKNKLINEAAEKYRNGFAYMADHISKSTLDGAKNIKIHPKYLPRKMSHEKFGELEKRIKFDGIVTLIERAIKSEQGDTIGSLASTAKTGGKKITIQSQKPLKDKLNVLGKKLKELRKKKPKATQKKALAKWEVRIEKLKNELADLDDAIKTGKQVDLSIPANKANILARAIAKATQMSKAHGGFDIEQLVKLRDPDKLKAYLEDVVPTPTSGDKADLAKIIEDLQQNIELITSGRLEKRIRLNETFETTINGIKVRFDDLIENDVDLLWQTYMNEMSGWLALNKRMGITGRNGMLDYQRKLNTSIDESYAKEGAKGRYGAPFGLASNKWKLQKTVKEEKETIDSFFKNILGRSAEDDPTNFVSGSLRALRKYSFMRVLNQVGIAQLPEFGVATAQQGFLTLVQELPHFRQLLLKAKKGELPDTFFDDFAVMGSANGMEHISRAITTTEIEDMGATAIGQIRNSSKGTFNNVTSVGEKATGNLSGLFFIDSLQRRMTMRLFVHRLAHDLIDVAKGGKDLGALRKSRLNRYRALGFTDEELMEIGKEFASKNVTSYQTAFGRRVLSFRFHNWKNQTLAYDFARKVNRYTQRAVQYNYLGDTNRFFTDKATGKTMGQFRSFIMTAWSKQFLHNIALADAQTLTTFLYTTMIGGMAYIAQTNMNAIGMNKAQKKKYFRKKFGSTRKKYDYSRIAMAAFQRSGWSSVIPPMADMMLSQLKPDYRFNFRSSGLEMNLITGNPSYDLVINGVGRTMGSFLKATRPDYSWSRTDFNRAMRLIPFQNLYGVNNLINFLRGTSPFPEKGTRSPL
jgi:hypothetical protein